MFPDPATTTYTFPVTPQKCASCRFWTPEHSGWGVCRMPLDVNSEVVGRFNTQAEFWCKAWEVKDAK